MNDDERADDDWFESAFEEEADEEPPADEDSADADAFDEDAAVQDEAADTQSADEDDGGTFNGDEGGAFEGEDGGAFDGDEGGAFEGEDGGAFDGEDGGAFDGDEGGAFGEEDADPFDGDAEDPFSSDADGGAASDDGGSLFDDDFASAMGSAGGGSAGSGDFDEEDFESEIPRIDLGISGLDDMIQGGIPERHLMVSIGSPGTGKTTFGLQFLYHGLQQGESAVFITLEQSREAIIDTANERGWEFDKYEEEGSLAIVDLDPVEMANSLDNIRGELPELIREFDAERLVLDSVSLLEMMYDDQSKRRTEVFDFTRSLKQAGVTTMLTSEASEDNPYASRHGIIEYLTDAVFILQYVRGDATETRLAVEIQKIRNANHSRATKPYDITLDGIDVYQQASIF